MDYQYCPKCAGLLEEGSGSFAGVPICSKCGFKFFQNSKPTAVAIFENEKGEILLARRAQNPQKGLWGLVGGFLDPGEEAHDGLRREVREELDCEIEDIKFLGSFVNNYMHDPGLKGAFTLDLYFTCGLIGEPSLSDEVDEVKWFAKQEIPWDEVAFGSNKKALRQYLELDKA